MLNTFIQSAIINPEDLETLNAYAKDNNRRIIFFDCTFCLPNSDDNPDEAYKQEHIPRAIRFNIQNACDTSNPLPHMRPTKTRIETILSNLGILNNDIIICYAQKTMNMGPARAWWLLKGFGHDAALVLNGNLTTYKNAGGQTTQEETPAFEKSKYNAKAFGAHSASCREEILNLINSGDNSIILDARPLGRFTGEQKEPRPGMKSGHIPKSKSLPCSELLNDSGKLKDKESLRSVFSERGVVISHDQKRIIATCGSGVTACSLKLALHHLGYTNVSVYDGSWSEWGQEELNLPIAIGT